MHPWCWPGWPCMEGRPAGGGCREEVGARWLKRLSFVVGFPVALAGQARGGAAHLEPGLPEDIPYRQLVGDRLQGPAVEVRSLLHRGHDLPEPRLGPRA